MTTTAANAQPTLTDQVTRMYDIIAGYHTTHLLEIARELGIWRSVTDQPGIQSNELAVQLQTNSFYTDALCRTAFAFGFLERESSGWRMAPHFDEILGNPESSFYLGDSARIHMNMGEDYKDYVALFRSGGTRRYQDHGDAFMDDVAIALKSLPRVFLDYVLPQLPDLQKRFEGGGRLLDVGCGAGWALVHFAQRYPSLRCTGVDVEPYSIKLAQQAITQHGLSERCQAIFGGVEDLEGLAEYDLATSFLVIHEINPSVKAQAFGRIANALAPGGAFLIFDEVYPEEDEDLRTMPKRFASLAQWYELTWGNRVNTRTELHALCEEAGLNVTEETSFSRFHILVASKPA